MDRKNGKIVYDQSEQAEFNVPGVMDVSVALETAMAFQDAADKVGRRGQDLITGAAEDDSSQELHKAEGFQARSVRLRAFANSIIEAAFKED